ncbi:MAG: Ca-activated chloride channel [Bryobacterales bacterium]|jgi:hypothetical protein|nr:Ca-activated chloride channel [Bryobacterales bacterium]
MTGMPKQAGECRALIAFALPFFVYGGPAGAQQEPFNISVDVSLVVLQATVHGRCGHSVLNLRQGDFQVYEDSEALNIRFLPREDTPVTVGPEMIVIRNCVRICAYIGAGWVRRCICFPIEYRSHTIVRSGYELGE